MLVYQRVARFFHEPRNFRRFIEVISPHNDPAYKAHRGGGGGKGVELLGSMYIPFQEIPEGS